jgi:hypothetical protein
MVVGGVVVEAELPPTARVEMGRRYRGINSVSGCNGVLAATVTGEYVLGMKADSGRTRVLCTVIVVGPGISEGPGG